MGGISAVLFFAFNGLYLRRSCSDATRSPVAKTRATSCLSCLTLGHSTGCQAKRRVKITAEGLDWIENAWGSLFEKDFMVTAAELKAGMVVRLEGEIYKVLEVESKAGAAKLGGV